MPGKVTVGLASYWSCVADQRFNPAPSGSKRSQEGR